eukprot:TRINITY_DN3310_c0_g1_i1.p1 TRINITY_DN3310_c0_g1~~TRINITY_DN3310_c0_g1_i1.p1  ORF type:complete len:126 (+),score=17.04 TRINITY_DN3310_c0_g1_i1:152-529(+)
MMQVFKGLPKLAPQFLLGKNVMTAPRMKANIAMYTVGTQNKARSSGSGSDAARMEGQDQNEKGMVREEIDHVVDEVKRVFSTDEKDHSQTEIGASNPNAARSDELYDELRQKKNNGKAKNSSDHI